MVQIDPTEPAKAPLGVVLKRSWHYLQTHTLEDPTDFLCVDDFGGMTSLWNAVFTFDWAPDAVTLITSIWDIRSARAGSWEEHPLGRYRALLFS